MCQLEQNRDNGGLVAREFTAVVTFQVYLDATTYFKKFVT